MSCLPGVQLMNTIPFEHLCFENKNKWLRQAESFLKVCRIIIFDSLKWLAALGFNQIVNQWLNCISVLLCNKTLAFDVLKLKCFVTALLLKVPPNLTA